MAADSGTAGPPPTQLVSGPSLSDQAYRALRGMITSGELRRGERITERALGDRLGVSATPVREAFRRLEHERLIERKDGRTVTVADPSDEQLAVLTMIQGALRGIAARLASTEASDEELTAIREAHDRTPSLRANRGSLAPAERVLTTRHFHELIDRAAHDDLLVDMIATTTAFDLAERIEAAEELGTSYPTDIGLDEHELIVEAITAHDPDTAERLMRAHVARTGQFFLNRRRARREAQQAARRAP